MVVVGETAARDVAGSVGALDGRKRLGVCWMDGVSGQDTIHTNTHTLYDGGGMWGKHVHMQL